MSATRPFEQSVLAHADGALRAASGPTRDPFSVRLEILEAAASQIGGWDLRAFRKRHPAAYTLSSEAALTIAKGVVFEVNRTAIPAPLALSSLARPDLTQADRRVAGVYYTDFRLAQQIGNQLIRPLRPRDKVVDPAAGTGILLVAIGLALTAGRPKAASNFVAHRAFAADLSAAALRGTRLSLASLTDSLDAIDALEEHLRMHDSLLVGKEGWKDVAPEGFDVVVGNPPWEKLKVSLHEYLHSIGEGSHYGDDHDYEALSATIDVQRSEMCRYTANLASLYPQQVQGEPDLYKAFLALSLELSRAGGQVGLLLPAGLIRSDGTRPLRQQLLSQASELRVTVMDNKARFFAIDTRFKFLSVHAVLSTDAPRSPIELRHAEADRAGVKSGGSVAIGRAALARVRPDLTIPEVRSPKEWKIVRSMYDAGPRFGSAEGWWRPSIVREVDMTRDRKSFTRVARRGDMAVIEGRMVHQFRTGAKSYESGTGRRAAWAVNRPGHNEIRPQFWIDPEHLSPFVKERSARGRVGFCDITGQTNERSMLASWIPGGVVCGNKVPTITFGTSETQQEAASLLWLAVANSLPFDWLLRRVITTTVNYFLLYSMPLPASLTLGSAESKRILKCARSILKAETGETEYSPTKVADWRAEIDARVALAYGLSSEDLAVMLLDFPLVDRGQPALPGEGRSTITGDLIKLWFSRLTDGDSERVQQRVAAALGAGAKAYIPADVSAAHPASRNGPGISVAARSSSLRPDTTITRKEE